MSAMPPLVPTAGPRSLVDRVKSILLQPRSEWPIIEAEPASIGSLYRYVLILAAIPAICGAVGLSMLGGGVFNFGVAWAVRFAVAGYVGALISVYVLALIIDALAPTFGGQKGHISALKVAVYSATAAWVAGIFSLIPLLGILGLVGAIYSLYLLYLGLPILMKSPQDKAAGYTIVTIIAAIVVWVVIGTIVRRLTGLGGGYGSYGGY
jgi:hypothetical protein